MKRVFIIVVDDEYSDDGYSFQLTSAIIIKWVLHYFNGIMKSFISAMPENADKARAWIQLAQLEGAFESVSPTKEIKD